MIKSKKGLHLFAAIAGGMLGLAYAYMFFRLPAEAGTAKKTLTAFAAVLFLLYAAIHVRQLLKAGKKDR
jgi:hypothetical protein